MSDGWAHDLVAMLQQSANEQVQDLELNLLGNVIEYDPETHMCRVLLPTRRAQDESGIDQPMETGWIQVGSGQVGDDFGDQYALRGGATAQNPEMGEQVQISVQHRASGLCAVANQTFNDTMQPPGAGAGGDGPDNATDDTDGTARLRAQERIIKFPAGAFLKFYTNGDVGLFAAQDLVLRVQNDLKITVLEGNATIDVQEGNLTATVDMGNASIHAVQGNISATADAGNVSVTATAGDISVTATAGDVSLTAGAEVNVTAPIVNIISGVINAGVGIMQQLANLFHVISTYNVHTHPVLGGPPVPLGVPGLDTTIDLEAS